MARPHVVADGGVRGQPRPDERRQDRLGCAAADAGDTQQAPAHSRGSGRACSRERHARIGRSRWSSICCGIGRTASSRRAGKCGGAVDRDLALLLSLLPLLPAADRHQSHEADVPDLRPLRRVSQRPRRRRAAKTFRSASIGVDASWPTRRAIRTGRRVCGARAIDHPESKAEVEDDCSICHMPITRYEAKLKGKTGEIFSFLPDEHRTVRKSAGWRDVFGVPPDRARRNSATKESFSGDFVVEPPTAKGEHPEYGPFAIDEGHQRIMQNSTGGFRPQHAAHIRDSELCATCHTLYTTARGAGGKAIGELPEQMPYLEWQHSDYRRRTRAASRATCRRSHGDCADHGDPAGDAARACISMSSSAATSSCSAC